VSLASLRFGGVFSIRRNTSVSRFCSSEGFSDMVQNDLQAFDNGRERTYSSSDRDLYLDVGFFISVFSSAELAITSLLAILTQSKDLAAFDLLCKGMDIRVKIQRIRQAANKHGGIGSNLQKRLDFFEKNAISLRNKISHRSFAICEDDGPRRYFLFTLSNMPWGELKFGTPLTPDKPETIPSLEIYACAMWVNTFRKDLLSVMNAAIDGASLEVSNPVSRLPQKDHQ
jgi:hypothetical protein